MWTIGLTVSPSSLLGQMTFFRSPSTAVIFDRYLSITQVTVWVAVNTCPFTGKLPEGNCSCTLHLIDFPFPRS